MLKHENLEEESSDILEVQEISPSHLGPSLDCRNEVFDQKSNFLKFEILLSEFSQEASTNLPMQVTCEQGSKNRDMTLQQQDSDQLQLLYERTVPTVIDAKLRSRYRNALRFLRKFFLKFYKSRNKSIIRKRYVNCLPTEISESVEATLKQLLAADIVTKDLVDYTKGILGLRDSIRMKSKAGIKQQVLIFQDTARNFSTSKFKQAMNSACLQTLCRCLAENSDDPRAQDLEGYINNFKPKRL
ncbi:unnamed protein product [Moneuplotes crassus]|uniref:Uncharacterized protein n=1 Tax=Euplotes crassus TaxID=5936 RepID=A0AAD2D879_EUPCR|nr:unnamed protein product [Moneuplotes crassus]